MTKTLKMLVIIGICTGLYACSKDDGPAQACDPECEASEVCMVSTGECVPDVDMTSSDMSNADMPGTMEGLCDAGEHVVDGECMTCLEGTMRPAGDDPTQGNTMCEPILCAEDFHVVANTCTPCAPASTRAAGDDASNTDTQCEPLLCVMDEFVVEHTCTPCAPGTTNLAGDDASGDDTRCDAVLCDVNQHVRDFLCVPCEPGTTRLAGDDASQGDTMCEPILCAENQRVLNHECIPCATGLTRAAGDDASGDDTACTSWETPLSMSDSHTCARMQDRTLKCWGRNQAGQLGLGSFEPVVQPTPTTVPGLTQVLDVSLGQLRSCVIVSPGQVKCWGSQGNDKWLGIESSDTFVNIPSDVRGETSALSLEIPRNGRWTCTHRHSNEVACWGRSLSGATGRFEMARWPSVVNNVTMATRLVLSNTTSCASLESGQVACWGSNFGKFANGTSQDSLSAQESMYPSPVLNFGVGSSHTCALLNTKEVWCSGSNVGNKVNASDDTYFLSPVQPEGLGVTEQLAVSVFFNCARGDDRKVRCWGTLSRETVYKTARAIENLDGAQDLQLGGSFGCALLDTGEVACWGANNHGQLGDGTFTDSVGTATRVVGISNAVAIQLGSARACALLDDGQIMCWGDNEYGMLGDGTTLDRNVPVPLNL